jgi:hypothetical protein
MSKGDLMNDKEKLYYLVREYYFGNYTTEIFCDEFSIQYNTETNYDNLSEKEHKWFRELSIVTERFSPYEEDLKLPNVYFNEKQVKEKTKEVIEVLGIINCSVDFNKSI